MYLEIKELRETCFHNVNKDYCVMDLNSFNVIGHRERQLWSIPYNRGSERWKYLCIW